MCQRDVFPRHIVIVATLYAQGLFLFCPQEEGIFIVCSGLVRVRYDVWQGTSQTYFLGTGGMFGLFSALTGARFSRQSLGLSRWSADREYSTTGFRVEHLLCFCLTVLVCITREAASHSMACHVNA